MAKRAEWLFGRAGETTERVRGVRRSGGVGGVWTLVAAVVLALVWCAPAAAASDRPGAGVSTGLVGEGFAFETPYFVRRSAEEGPTVFIIGGMHGNEPAGAEAADQIRHWPIERGTLVVIPRANPPALARDVRRIPGKERQAGDLNRNFPATRSERGPVGPTAEHIWEFVVRLQPDWVLDLHEGYDFHVRNPRSVGSSIIHFDNEDTNPYVAEMLGAVNAEVDDEEKVFQSIPRGPVETGLVRAAIHHLGARGMVLETTRADQRMSLRTRQHRLMVHALLDELGMVTGGAHVLFGQRGENGEDTTLRVALYDDAGAGGGGVSTMTRLVTEMEHAAVRRVGASDIRDGVLEQFDVVVFPGGRGGRQGQELGREGRDAVRAFVERGGGYVGICAGAYLATCRLDSYLKMVRSYHHRPWQLGRGQVEIELTELGGEILGGDEARYEVRYANGPVFVHEDGLEPDLDLPGFDVLATYTRGVERDGERQRVMEGTPAIVAAPYGDGRVVLISPHPESGGETAWMATRAIEWAAGRVGVATSQRRVHPQRTHRRSRTPGRRVLPVRRVRSSSG